jgi:hypothetical protein
MAARVCAAAIERKKTWRSHEKKWSDVAAWFAPSVTAFGGATSPIGGGK